MKDRFAHFLWLIFRVGYTISCESVAEQIVVRSEVGIFGKFVQYSTSGFMELFNGLANNSKVVLKQACIAEARLCVIAH